MAHTEFSPLTAEVVEITQSLQEKCIKAYLTVASSLRTEMSEAGIERMLLGELATQDITDFWYNIPILVLAGTERFMKMADDDYDIKASKEDVILKPGMPLFVDIHPRDKKSGRWGNFAATLIYDPQDNEEAVNFLRQMQQKQEAGIGQMTPRMTAEEVYGLYDTVFQQEEIQLVDVRAKRGEGNFGHSMEEGEKRSAFRSFLQRGNPTPLGGHIFGVEPGGFKLTTTGKEIVVARFEDCVHVPLKGQSRILGRTQPVPVTFGR